MTDDVPRAASLPREETLLAWSAVGVLVAAIAFTVGAIFLT